MMRMMPLMQALDADGDGELSSAEIANAPAALKKLDKNGDGKLDAEELRPSMGGRGGPGGPGGPGAQGGANVSDRVNQIMAMDKNGDGKLAADELPERMQGIIARADADKDGFVTKAELEAFMGRQAQGQGQGPGRGPGGPEGNGGQGRRGARPSGE
jgi:Ca2+-binding EF-hand superfamily protein